MIIELTNPLDVAWLPCDDIYLLDVYPCAYDT
jgi:hypothetical protein